MVPFSRSTGKSGKLGGISSESIYHAKKILGRSNSETLQFIDAWIQLVTRVTPFVIVLARPRVNHQVFFTHCMRRCVIFDDRVMS